MQKLSARKFTRPRSRQSRVSSAQHEQQPASATPDQRGDNIRITQIGSLIPALESPSANAAAVFKMQKLQPSTARGLEASTLNLAQSSSRNIPGKQLSKTLQKSNTEMKLAISSIRADQHSGSKIRFLSKIQESENMKKQQMPRAVSIGLINPHDRSQKNATNKMKLPYLKDEKNVSKHLEQFQNKYMSKIIYKQALEHQSIQIDNQLQIPQIDEINQLKSFLNSSERETLDKQRANEQKQKKDELEFRNFFHLQAVGQGNREIQVGSMQLQPSSKEVPGTAIPIRNPAAASLSASNTTPDLLESNLTKTAASGQLSGANTQFSKDLQNALLHQQGNFNQSNQRMNRQRFQGKLIFEWLNLNVSEQASHLEKYQALEVEKVQKFLYHCSNILQIVDTSLSSVIEEYAKGKCQEWAAILQQVQRYSNEFFDKTFAKQEALFKVLKKDFENKLKDCEQKRTREVEQAMAMIPEFEKRIEMSQKDVNFHIQMNKESQEIVNDQRQRIAELNETVRQQRLQIEKRDEKIETLELKVVSHKSKKKFIKTAIQQQIHIRTQIEEELQGIRQDRLLKPDQTSQGSVETLENTDETDENEDKEQEGEDSNNSSISASKRRSSENKKNRKEKREMKEQEVKEFIKLQQRDYTPEALRENGMIQRTNTDHENEQNAQKKTAHGRSVSLGTIDIVDSESDEMACSVINAAPVIIAEEHHAKKPSHVSAESNAEGLKEEFVEDQERRFIKQGVFIARFMQELRINEQFDKLQRYTQEKILNDEFILRIILSQKPIAKRPASPVKQQRASSSRQQRERPRSPEVMQQRSKSAEKDSLEKGNSMVGPRSKSALKTDKQSLGKQVHHDKKAYTAYLKPLQTFEMLQQNFQKQPFKLRAENLFEIVHAILGQMFLTEIDTIDRLMYDLRLKFPTHGYLINNDYVNNRKKDKAAAKDESRQLGIAQKINAQLEVPDVPQLDSKSSGQLTFNNNRDRLMSSNSARKTTSSQNQLQLLNTDQTRKQYAKVDFRIENPQTDDKDAKTADTGTQTGEEYDEFLILNSIKGMDSRSLYLSGENDMRNLRTQELFVTNSTAIQLHKIDQYNKKLVKINLRTNRRGLKTIEAEEYLPKQIVENFLPFNCLIKLDEMAHRHMANIQGYENTKSKKKVTEINVDFDLGFSSHRALPALNGYQVQPEQSAKNRTQPTGGFKHVVAALGLKNDEAHEILNNYHKVLFEATTQYPTKDINLQYLKALQFENQRKLKNTFSVLPPQHQEMITSSIESTIETQLNIHQAMVQDQNVKKEDLYQFELQLDRMNLKIKFLLGYIQELELMRDHAIADVKAARQQPKKTNTAADFKENSKALLRAHDDGFKLGLTQGKMLGSQVETHLILNQGQQNGMKHGWISGFEAGQIAGIKKVFVEAYMNNINLYDKFQSRNKDTSVLDQIDIKELRRERMNEFNKMFKEVQVISNNTNRQKRVIENFKSMNHFQKLKYKKISKKPLLKLIQQIYNEKTMTKIRTDRDISLVEAMMKHISLNYGNNNITDARIFRVFGSAFFNSAIADTRQELEKNLIKYEKMGESMNSQGLMRQTTTTSIDTKLSKVKSQSQQQQQTPKRQLVSFQIIHFTKFCQINEGMNNLSEEVLSFYLDILAVLKEQQANKFVDDVDAITRVIVDDVEIDVVSQHKVVLAVQQKFERMLSSSFMNIYKKVVENQLKVKDETTAMQYIDLDRFLDHSVILFLRFNQLYIQPLHKLYFAWTLFTVDYIDFDQIYITLKLLCNKDTGKINFNFPGAANQRISKSVKEVMQQVHDRFGGSSQKEDVKKSDSQAGNQLFAGFDDPQLLLGRSQKATVTDVEEGGGINHQVATLMKIRQCQQQFPDRHDCSLSKDQFLEVFHHCDVYSGQMAFDFFRLPYNQLQLLKLSKDRLISKDFDENCRSRLNKMKKKKEQMVRLLEDVKDKQVHYMRENHMDPETGKSEEVKVVEDHLCKDRKVKVRPPKQEASIEADAVEKTKVDQLSCEHHSVSTNLGDKSNTDNPVIGARAQESPLYDLKPYLRRMAEWGQRLRRLEHKMGALAPELVFLSLEIHERALDLLASKLDKFMKMDDVWRMEEENDEAQKALKAKDQQNERTKVTGRPKQQKPTQEAAK